MTTIFRPDEGGNVDFASLDRGATRAASPAFSIFATFGIYTLKPRRPAPSSTEDA
jgi:hypothetical protein